ncbi:hypothetical protein E4695_15115 [Alcaligenaceae bacterium 429]|nr:hypothetical protein E4695_15115 [Alcaligenaceae bacterium 429]
MDQELTPSNHDRWFRVYQFGRFIAEGAVPQKRIFTNKEFQEIIKNMGSYGANHQKTMGLIHEMSKFAPTRLRYEANKRIAWLFNAAMTKKHRLDSRSLSRIQEASNDQ